MRLPVVDVNAIDTVVVAEVEIEQLGHIVVVTGHFERDTDSPEFRCIEA